MNKALEAAIGGVINANDMDVSLERYAQGAIAGLADHVGGKSELRRIRNLIAEWGATGTADDFALAVRMVDVVQAMENEL